jgi:prepilin signal peptidase PulO-like enzyme (type II secretory pathway)
MSVLVFIIGLAIGSFINAAVYRLYEDLPLGKGRSMCVHCKHTLGFFDLFPLFSFIFLNGKCRYCSKPISWQYPLVELATAFLFTWFWNTRFIWEFWGEPLFWGIIVYEWAILGVLMFLFVFDYKYYLLPDLVTLPSIVIFLIWGVLLGHTPQALLFGGLVGGGFFALQFLASKGRWIGGGDIRMGALMGVILGWQNLVVALFIAYISGALWGVALIAMGKKELGGKLPFGTFLAVGTVASMLYGSSLLNWYLGFL